MTEAKRKRLLLGVFIVALVVGLLMKPWERRRARVPVKSDSPPVEAAVQAGVTAAAIDPAARAPEIHFATAWPKNPFRLDNASTADHTSEPIVPVVVDDQVPQLQGIMRVDGRHVCIIGRRTYVVGETVDGWTISAIRSDGITLARGGRTIRLTLP